jgi:hypothetical protein
MAEEKRHAARQAMLDGTHELEAYREAMARIDAEPADELADVPALPNRDELRERGAAVVAEALARFYCLMAAGSGARGGLQWRVTLFPG